MAETWPFTAREHELAAALAALDAPGTVVLGGPAGVGKSRLAREIARRAGSDVGIVRATASAQEVPLGALADVVSVAGPDGAPPDLADLREAVRALAHDLLVVDDAHLLDEVSAAVVHQVVSSGRARVVLTVRTGDPAPDAVTALWKDELAARIEIEPFDRDQTSTVLSSVLGGGLEARTARLLHDTARGNVLWLRHLVEGERAAGRLARLGSTWAWTGQVVLSPALDELVAARIGDLSDEQRRVLELLAVAEPLGLGMLESLAGSGPVEEVAQRGLVSVEPDGDRWELRFAHPLYGEAVRARTSVPRARRLRSELSAAFASTGGRRAGDGLRRAVLDLGSDRPLDPAVLVTAAMQASGLGDLPLAERLLRAAVEAGGGFEARAGLAHLLTYQLRSDDADAVLEEAVAEAATPQERTRALTLRVLHRHVQARTPLRSEGLVAEAEARETDGRRDPAHDALRTVFHAFDGRVDEALTLGGAVLADGSRPDHAVALAGWAVALLRSMAGRGEGLAEVVEQGISAAARSPEMAAMQCNIGFAEIVDADLQARPGAGRHRLDWVRSLSGPQAPVFVALYEGRTALGAGLPRTAAQALDACLPAFPGHGGGWGAWLVAMISRAHAMLGDVVGARRLLDEAQERRHPFLPVLDFELDLSRGWLLAAEGDLQGGIGACRRGAARCREHGTRAAEVLLRQTAVRFGDREQVVPLAELATALRTPRAQLAAAHAAALAEHDPERLLTVAGELAEAGMLLEGTDAAAQAAAVARTRHRRVLAAEAEDRARELAGRAEDACTPALREAQSPVPLSAREREVAALAGEGLTNRQIAERLHVSVRTVESHVYRACSRLGLSDRAALVAVAGVRRPRRESSSH
ncbi:LuxR C-terminal-related transcriptional regulator [Actinomycetospora atypica]|uniref:LuxR C-terminal-related transcriptional regulator n=1 Tax=Actinomycetospora atypica TaxID=1290095 RepID=A0ABV9YWW3_9PSEU